jgi:hypothetical protein
VDKLFKTGLWPVAVEDASGVEEKHEECYELYSRVEKDTGLRMSNSLFVGRF